MIDQILLTLTPSGNQVVGKIMGNEKADTILFLSHGFGVDSDSGGMFSAISEIFKEKYLIVRFHYVAKDEYTEDKFVYPHSKQVEKLQTVIEKITTKYPNKKLIIVGHSQGCFVPPMYLRKKNITIKKLILIAPPINTEMVDHMIKHFSKKKETKINLNSMSQLKSSAGNMIHVPKEFWEEVKNIGPIDLYQSVIDKYETHFIIAENDTVLDPKENIKLKALKPTNYYSLPNDHNFKGDNWLGLLGLLNKIL